VYAKSNFSFWKSRVQFVFHNKQIHSQFYIFSVTVIKIRFLLVQNDVEKGCKVHKLSVSITHMLNQCFSNPSPRKAMDESASTRGNKFAVIPHTLITASTFYPRRFCSCSD